jgi:hypothetical protein
VRPVAKRKRIPLPALISTLILLAIASLGQAQTRIDNPGHALAKNAGRIVKLEEVLRIRDDGETSVFKSPRHFSLGPDRSLFFVDFAEGPRLYRYSADGKLISKLLKNGQGPGECQNASHYVVAGDLIRVLSWIPPKIMDFGMDGRYLRESKVEEDSHGLWFLGTAGGKIYGIRDEVFSSAAFRSEGVFTVPNGVYEISPDFKTWKKIYEFPVRMVIKRARGAFRLDPIDAVIHGTALFILHTAEYRVTELDLRSGSVKRVISRAYDRVRGITAKATDTDPETRGIEFPDDPYVWDIDKIHATPGRLWVFTSVMKSDGNDHLVDIFDAEGRFLDSVILRYPPGSSNHRFLARWTLMTDDGFFFVPEQDEEGLVSIGKYRILDADLFPAETTPKRTP